MSGKQLSFSDDARRAILQGVNTLADTVKVMFVPVMTAAVLPRLKVRMSLFVLAGVMLTVTE